MVDHGSVIIHRQEQRQGRVTPINSIVTAATAGQNFDQLFFDV